VERLKAAGTLRAAPVVCWVVALGVAVQGAVHNLTRPLADRLPDLHVYVLAVTALVHGGGLYRLHAGEAARFTYPPFAGVAFFPIAYLPEPVTRVLWTVLTIVAVAGLWWILTPHLPRRLGPRAIVWPLLTAVVLASKPVQSNLWFGQISVFLALAVTADVLALQGRRGQGVLTGLAAAIKLTPLVFVPYLWLTGRRRAALVAAGSFALATAAGAALTPSNSRAYWFHYVVHESASLPLANNGNQSIYALLLREGLHGAGLGVAWVALGVALGSLGLWRSRRAWLAGQPLLSLAMAGCVAILVSPISWTHHKLWILLAAGGVFTATGWVDAVIVALLVVPMLIGLPGVDALAAPGRWAVANYRVVLAALVACALPFRRLPAAGEDAASTGPGERHERDAQALGGVARS